VVFLAKKYENTKIDLEDLVSIGTIGLIKGVNTYRLDKNIKLVDYSINNDVMILNFNNSIFLERDNILEEVVYSISYSVFANYDVSKVIFQVDGVEVFAQVV